MQLQFPWVLEHTKDVTDAQWLIITGIGFLLVVFLIVKFVWPIMFQPHLVQRQQGIEHAAAQVESTLRETKQKAALLDQLTDSPVDPSTELPITNYQLPITTRSHPGTTLKLMQARHPLLNQASAHSDRRRSARSRRPSPSAGLRRGDPLHLIASS